MIFEKENVMLMTGHVMCINEMGKELSACETFHLLGACISNYPRVHTGVKVLILSKKITISKSHF